MYQKKDYVYVESLGVCRVEEVTSLAEKDGTSILYYGVRSMRNQGTTAYYPVEDHKVEIRNLISLEEAMKIVEEYEKEKEAEVTTEENRTPVSDKVYEAKFVIELDKKIKAKKASAKK